MIQHALSVPHSPQSNGLVEVAIKSMKYFITTTVLENEDRKDENLDKNLSSLVEYRNAPMYYGFSRADLLHGLHTSSNVPVN